jgi:hypothetical protein
MLGHEHYPRWSQTLGTEFSKLQAQVADDLPSLFGAYAASNPAEFFAVASEVFFEQPRRMATEHPELYVEFRRYYRLDPQSWQ